MIGAGLLHISPGIILQDVITGDSEYHDDVVSGVPAVPGSKTRSLELPVQRELLDCYVCQRH